MILLAGMLIGSCSVMEMLRFIHNCTSIGILCFEMRIIEIKKIARNIRMAIGQIEKIMRCFYSLITRG